MLKTGVLDAAFRIYWDEMQLCRDSRTYWSLLHVTTCLPSICAAMQTDSGDTRGADRKLYAEWCDRYLQEPKLTGVECYEMRCKILHQGRAQAAAGRYTGFAFTQPPTEGQVYHLAVENGTKLVVDVSRLAEEMRQAVRRWISDLEARPAEAPAANAARHVASLVQVRPFRVPQPPGTPPSTWPQSFRSS
jgi:hypothetical protein